MSDFTPLPHEEIVHLADKICSRLLEFGISPKNKGYEYLREGITLVIQNAENIHQITTKMYPTIAQRFSTTPFAVERAIRYAIARAWRHYPSFSSSPLSLHNGKKLSNGEFIAFVAESLSLQN